MVSRTNRLYLISVKYQIVAIIPAKDAFDSINKYLMRIGFVNPHAYFCRHLITNDIILGTSNPHHKQCFGIIDATTIDDDILNISSQLVVKCNDIFSWKDVKNINNPLFMRPTIEEVRNCVGFSRTPIYKLRKFCI